MLTDVKTREDDTRAARGWAGAEVETLTLTHAQHFPAAENVEHAISKIIA